MLCGLSAGLLWCGLVVGLVGWGCCCVLLRGFTFGDLVVRDSGGSHGCAGPGPAVRDLGLSPYAIGLVEFFDRGCRQVCSHRHRSGRAGLKPWAWAGLSSGMAVD